MHYLEEELDTTAMNTKKNNGQVFVEGHPEGGLRIWRNGSLWKAPSLSQWVGIFVPERIA